MNLPLSDRISREASLGDKVADLLRKRILNGELPRGTHLVEDSLATQLGTSRYPLRNAFHMLAREGLVSINQGKGTYVTGLTQDSMEQLNIVRIMLETGAIELATQNIDDQGAAELRKLVDGMASALEDKRLADLADLDIQLHQKIWSLSGNYHLIRVLEYVMSPYFALMKLNLIDLQMWRTVIEKHHGIVAAIASGDKTSAVELLREVLWLQPEGPFPRQ